MTKNELIMDLMVVILENDGTALHLSPGWLKDLAYEQAKVIVERLEELNLIEFV